MYGRLLIVGCVLLAACGEPTAPSTPPSQEGLIVERDRATTISEDRPTIWVKEDPDAECGIIFTIASGTDLVLRHADGRTSEAQLSDLGVGAAVRVWADIVLLSCPGQSTAEAVEVVVP